MPRPIYGLCVGLLAIACDGGDVPRFPATVSAVDVHHFAAAWIRRKDSTCTAFRSYFDSASMGLRAYASKFHVGADEVCASVRRSPDRYVTVVANVSAFDSAAVQVESVFTRYRMLDPSARMPSVYFVVGNAIAGGATTRGRDPIILIGAELNATAKGMSWIIAHELAHTQQHYPLWGSMTGGPAFLRANVLRQAITEGSADLVAEVLTGKPKREPYAESHEATLWNDFRRDLHSRDYTLWFYNGRSSARGERPPDLGYWIGYRIAKAYYERRSDRARAIHDILTIRDFDAFLVSSGYDGTTTTARGQPQSVSEADTVR